MDTISVIGPINNFRYLLTIILFYCQVWWNAPSLYSFSDLPSKDHFPSFVMSWLLFVWMYWWDVVFFIIPNCIVSPRFVLHRSTERRCLSGNSPAATADHMTKNIPTAILFKEEGSRPRCFRMGSTTLSFRGISRRMSTASNMVSQAAGKRNVIWGGVNTGGD